MDQTLLSRLRQLLNPTLVSRAVPLSVYNPELIYSITWQDLKESATSDKVYFNSILNFFNFNFLRELHFNFLLQFPSVNRLHMPFSTMLKLTGHS